MTVSGVPVRVVKVDASVLILQSLVSDSRIALPVGCPLRPFVETEMPFELRPKPYGLCPDGAANERLPKPPRPLAPLIDELLLAGDKTMRGIVRDVRRRASASCHGKDIKANIRARLYWFRTKGSQVETDGQGRMKVVPMD